MISKEALRPQELVALDYDGTAADENMPVGETVVKGVDALHSAGISTTLITARPFQRLVAVAQGAENIGRIISPNMPLVTERGGRFVDVGGTTNIHYRAFSVDELDRIAEIECQENIDFLGFYPKNLQESSHIWTPDKSRTTEMHLRFGRDATILPIGRNALRNALRNADPCVVTVKFKKDDPINQTVLDPGLNVSWEKKTGAVVAHGVDKLSALHILCDLVGIDISQVSYAGNDISDLPILRMKELRRGMFVGNNPVGEVPDSTIRLPSPRLLGEYLSGLTNEGAI